MSGIDSLYVSYSGNLSETRAEQLESLKTLAQSSIAAENALAALALNDHLFEVRDRGKGRFPYLLADNWFHVQVSGLNASRLPLAYVQLSSEVLTRAGWVAALSYLNKVLDALQPQDQEPTISRVDLCTDFTTSVHLDALPAYSWVTRSKRRSRHYIDDRFTGLTFGQGGDLSCRLYDKTEELKKSRKTYLYPVWQAKGWDGVMPVWRLEFQFRRSVLRELGIESPEDLALHTADLWVYAVSQWLRLAIPNHNDATRARWPTHGLWELLLSAEWDWDPGEPLSRIRKARLPDDHYLFFNGISGITSYMASKGIEDFYDGLKGFITDAVAYHRLIGIETGENLQDYALAKAREKARRYNTLINPREGSDDGTEGRA
ncbi:MAG: hypothetical protein AAGA91_01930 [Pseudomonadota bacterium]